MYSNDQINDLLKRREHLRKIKAIAIRNNKDNLSLFCYRQIKLINKVYINN